VNGFFQFLAAHWGVIALTGTMAATAVFVTMPADPPRTAADLWHWFYDAVHQFANLRNQRPIHPSD
jgi:hypothetical protein